MKKAGIDTNVFKGHSTQSASTSKAKAQGLSCKQILEHAKWTKKSTFQEHYIKDIVKDSKANNAFQSLVVA